MLFIKNKPLFEELNKSLLPNSYSIKPLVSVCLITYNHGPFLKKTLDSIVEQQTNFDFELIIGDDCSTDSTREVIKPYLEKYPEKIKCFFHPKNLSKSYPEFTVGKLNFIHGLSNCTGKYIVHIEGDDYFTDPLKLQKQVDFLDANQEFSACFHNALMHFNDESDQEDYLINPVDQKKVITTEDLLIEGETWFMATAAVMFKSVILNDFKQWFGKSKSGDIPLYVLLTQLGPIGYLADTMSVYRRHLGGLSYTDDRKHADFVENRIYMFSHLNKQTNGKYKSLINPILADFYALLAETNEHKDNVFKRITYLFKSCKFNNFKDLSGTASKIPTPYLLQRYKNLIHKLKISS